MASEEMKLVRKLLVTYPDFSKVPIQDLRALMDQTANLFPLPEGVSSEETEAEGVRAEWVRAPGAKEDTVVLYFHGGGYVIGSPASHRHLAAAVSHAAGAVVLSLDYRLAPEKPFPAAVQDAVSGYRWILGQGIAPEQVALAGDSAGGGLTVATLLALREEGEPLPAAGVCMSPWVDLTCSSDTYRTKAETDALVKKEDVLRYASLYLAGQDPEKPLASPLFADHKGLPPILIHVGSEEVLLDDSVGLDRRLKESGVDATLEVWEEMIHVWHVFHPILKEGRHAISRIGEFVRQHMP